MSKKDELLVKGKSKDNGLWAIGYYESRNGIPFIGDYVMRVPVDEDTICRYLPSFGFYEGDIVSHPSFNHLFEVRANDYCVKFCDLSTGNEYFADTLYAIRDGFLVEGNIYDNPELFSGIKEKEV